MFKTMDK